MERVEEVIFNVVIELFDINVFKFNLLEILEVKVIK